jgi:LysM repeat protein
MDVDELKHIYTDTYTVQKGESLLKIAMQFGVKANELAYINNIYSENIFPNQVRHSLPLKS